MLKAEVARNGEERIIVMDSITKLAPEDVGAIVVSASHGGTSSGEFALEVSLKLVFFNDAGVGKDGAGTAALAMLDECGIAAGTVSHLSARIGDSLDMWNHGVISHLNAAAKRLGFAEGAALGPVLSASIAARPDMN